MNKKMVLALMVAVASGSSLFAEGDEPGFFAKALGAVEGGATFVRDNVLDAPAKFVFKDKSVLANNTNEKVSFLARLALTAFVVNEVVKKEKVQAFLKKVTEPITRRCCRG